MCFVGDSDDSLHHCHLVSLNSHTFAGAPLHDLGHLSERGGGKKIIMKQQNQSCHNASQKNNQIDKQNPIVSFSSHFKWMHKFKDLTCAH